MDINYIILCIYDTFYIHKLMCATRRSENDMIRNLHSYWPINNFIYQFDSDIHIYLNSIFIYTHTKISLPLFPIGPSKFAILFTRARIQIMMTMTILSTRPFGLIISLLYLIQAGVLFSK